MTHVAYKGPYDRWTLAAADLKKAGVEGFSKTVFPLGDPVEVDEAVAKALTENKLFQGHFSEVEAEESLSQGELNLDGDSEGDEEAALEAGAHASTSDVTPTGTSSGGSTSGSTTSTAGTAGTAKRWGSTSTT